MAASDHALQLLLDEHARIGAAIAVLRDGSEGGSAGVRGPARPSVRTRLIDLIESEDRSWTTPAALVALEEQGQAVQSTYPALAVASTLADLVRGQLAVRESQGVYRAAKFSSQHSATQPP